MLDDAGRLVHVSTVHTDEEIEAALAPYVEGDCLVAIDAPLIVTNATGNRPAEAALNKDFARFDAGAHPANTGKPEFSGTPRGAGLCQALGLDMNPRSGRARRAIEVYPHPATVALFGLGRTLKYKHKPGRDLDLLRAELLVLIGLLEGLADGRSRLDLDADASGWTLRRQVETATRKSELRVVEDQVDAVVCAYVALFVAQPARDDHDVRRPRDRLHRHARRSRPDLTPSPRPPKPAGDPGRPGARVRRSSHPALRRRRRAVPRAGDRRSSTTPASTTSRVTGRTKTVASFAEKARRTKDGVPLYTDPLQRDHRHHRDPRDHLRAQRRLRRGRPAARPGGRARRPRHGPRDRAGGAVRLREPAPADRAGRGPRGARDVRAAARPQRPGADPHGAAARVGGVRARHPLQGHDARRARPRLRPPVHPRRRAARARRPGVLHDPGHPARLGEPGRAGPSPTTTRASTRASWRRSWPGSTPRPAGRAPTTTPGSPGCCSSSASPRSTSSATCCAAVDEDAIRDRMDYRYPPGAVRRLDDALLAAYGSAYVGLRGNAHRRAALEARLEKLNGGLRISRRRRRARGRGARGWRHGRPDRPDVLRR